MRTIRLVPAALVVLLFAEHLAAQSFQGGLRGTVRDPQGVIPGATVTLVNQEAGVSRDTTTNDAGEYSFPGVPPGVYTIRASVAGHPGPVHLRVPGTSGQLLNGEHEFSDVFADQACGSIPRAHYPGREISQPTWNPPHGSGLDLPCLDANAAERGSFPLCTKNLAARPGKRAVI